MFKQLGIGLAFVLAAGASGCAALSSDPVAEDFQVTLPSVEETLAPGLTHLYFSDWAGPRVPVWVYIPHTVEPADAPILFMMHGAKRGAARYLASWDEVADANGFIVVAPEFNRDDFPGSANYNRGNVFNDDGVRNPKEDWTFSAIEPIFDWVSSMVGSNQDHFTLYGHSAGSQFVHRYILFNPDAPVDRVLAANAGWYTFASMETPWPYGVKNTGVSEADLITVLERDIVVLLGDADNDPNHESLRRSDGANAQGAHRFARGNAYFEAARAEAARLGADFGWSKRVFPGVAHSKGEIAAGSGDLVE